MFEVRWIVRSAVRGEKASSRLRSEDGDDEKMQLVIL